MTQYKFIVAMMIALPNDITLARHNGDTNPPIYRFEHKSIYANLACAATCAAKSSFFFSNPSPTSKRRNW